MPNIDFPVVVPEPCTLFGAEVDAWYRSAISKIADYVDISDQDMSTLTHVWAAKSRLRYAAAMALIDQDTAIEFLRDNPLPNTEELLKLGDEQSSETTARAIKLLLDPPPIPVDQGLIVHNLNVAYSDAVMPHGQDEQLLMADEGWRKVKSVLPPRPVVPNPEYIPIIEPFFTVANIWKPAPKIKSPSESAQEPCLVVYGGSLWLGYLTESDGIAVVCFSGYIEHQESRVGTMLEGHPYFNAGLAHKAFNELSKSLHTKYWIQYPTRHWVVNFSDRTIDIVALSADIVNLPVACQSTFDGVKAAIEISSDQ